MKTHRKPLVRTSGRFGSALSDGAAHQVDHESWSRRDFLSRMGLAALGSAMTLKGVDVQAYGDAASGLLAGVETDRVMVLVRLQGGNDGLNTLIPFEDPLYYQFRPRLGISKSEVIKWSDTLGIHPDLSALDPIFQDGDLGVVTNVGYPDPSFSHFDATDIWVSGQSGSGSRDTGWAGRYLEDENPDFAETPPPNPLAVEVGGATHLFKGMDSRMGVSVVSAGLLARLAETGLAYSQEGLPSTKYGDQVRFVRSVASAAYRYAPTIVEAAEQASNDIEYPSRGGAMGSFLESLALIARLIKGRLGARLYMITLGGFDTHGNQLQRHSDLLSGLGPALKAFTDDMKASGDHDRVLTMTFSEFGRRPFENGSGGTDHGSVAPVFLMGGGVRGGINGREPGLADLDGSENLKFETDFRSVYETVLQDWFGLDESGSVDVLGAAYGTLPLISDSNLPTSNELPVAESGFVLHQNYPNPASNSTSVEFELGHAGSVSLELFDTQGRLARSAVRRAFPVGKHRIDIDISGLASGPYVYRVITEAGTDSKTLIVG